MPPPTSSTTTLRTSATSTKQKRLSGGARPSSNRSPKGTEVKTYKSKKKGAGSDSDDENMSFLQFCPTCEQQILVPNHSILYCSEKCRRDDCGMSPPPTPRRAPDVTVLPSQAIVPPLSPTQIKQPSFARPGSGSGTSAVGNARSNKQERPPHERSGSEAAQYLSQFQSNQNRIARPRSSRNLTNVPSLSSTPSSTPSSVPFTPSSERIRPLSSRSFASKSIDLVLPAAVGPESPPSLETITSKTADMQIWAGRGELRENFDEEDSEGTPRLSYEKRKYGGEQASSAKSSLKTLLGSTGPSKTRGSETEMEKIAAAA